MTVIPLVVGGLKTVPKGLENRLEKSEIRERIKTIQTSVLLRPSRKLTWFLGTWGDLRSLRHQWKSYKVKMVGKTYNEGNNYNICFQMVSALFCHMLHVASDHPTFHGTVGWGRRIHRLLLRRGVRPQPNECSRYDTKQSDGKVLKMLELWEMWITPLLSSLPGPPWPGEVASDRILYMDQIEIKWPYTILNCLKKDCFNI